MKKNISQDVLFLNKYFLKNKNIKNENIKIIKEKNGLIQQNEIYPIINKKIFNKNIIKSVDKSDFTNLNNL